MENDFGNLTAKVWAIWIIQSRAMILVNFLYAALSCGTLLISVMSQHYNCLMELYTNFKKLSLFIKMNLPTTFTLIVMLGLR